MREDVFSGGVFKDSHAGRMRLGEVLSRISHMQEGFVYQGYSQGQAMQGGCWFTGGSFKNKSCREDV